MQRLRKWMPAGLIVAGALAYANSLTGPFIFDDAHGITDNSSIRQLATALTPPPASGMGGRPLVNLTFALNYAAGQFDVRGYHAVNLTIHLLAGLVLFGVLRRTVKDDLLAWSAALIWLVHPLLTESVVYISQRTEMLMGLFLLLTLYCSIRGWYLAAIAACGVGMGCKEVMAVAPVLVVLYDYVFLPDKMRERRWFYAGLAATWLMVPLLLGGISVRAKMGEGTDSFTPWEYAMTQCTVLVHYLRLCFVPYPLVVDYDDWPRVKSLTTIIPQGVLILSLLALSVWGTCRRRWWGYAGAWFFLILAPTSSFLPLGTEVAAERRMYLPLIAVIVPVVVLLRSQPVVLWVLALGLGGMTVFRNADYRTAEKIWQVTVNQRPDNVRALVNLATVVQPAESVELYERVLTITPDNPEAHYNLAAVLAGQNRLPDALPHFQRAAELSPRSSLAQYQLALALANLKQLPAAKAAVRRALELEPSSVKAQQLLNALEQQR